MQAVFFFLFYNVTTRPGIEPETPKHGTNCLGQPASASQNGWSQPRAYYHTGLTGHLSVPSQSTTMC